MSTQLNEIVYADSKDTPLLSAVASQYHDCSIDGRTSLGNYGYG
jgi:hypothetical protein